MDENDFTSQPLIGRHVMTTVWGNTLEELELAALDQARDLFGRDARLTVSRDYGVSASERPGAKWVTCITVREVPPA